MEIVKIKLKDIVPYEGNAKLHPREQVEQIKKSIQDFGNNDPIAVDEDNVIIEGHGRYMALSELGYDEADCIVLTGLTDDQKNAYRLVHNKLTMNSDFDFEILKSELEKIEMDMSQFDFDMEGIAKDLDGEKEAEEDDFDVDEAIPEEPMTKLGDVWKLGNHYLMCGDSTLKENVDKLMSGGGYELKKADLVFTDPPYGNGESGKYGRGQLGVRTILNDENLNCFNDYISIMDCDKIIYFLQWRTLAESFKALNNKDLKINTVAVWDKKNAGLNGAGGISEQWEAIIFAGNIKYKKFGGNVFSVAREQHKRINSPHPHQKPIKLLQEILDFIDNAQIIFDPFGGSGSTLILCEQLNRVCYTMELDPKYCDVIIKRWETLTGNKAELIK